MLARGQTYKSLIVAAFALRGIYTVEEMASAVGVSPGAVNGWFNGSQPNLQRIASLARETGMDRTALTEFIHYGGPRPPLPTEDAEAGERRDAARQATRNLGGGGASEEPHAPLDSMGSGR